MACTDRNNNKKKTTGQGSPPVVVVAIVPVPVVEGKVSLEREKE